MSILDHVCDRCAEALKKVGGRLAYIPKGRVLLDPQRATRLRERGLAIDDIAKQLGVRNRRVYQLLSAG